MKKVSVVSHPRTDRVSSSEAIDHGQCELDGGRRPSNLITLNTNQCQTLMRISCFNTQSLGKKIKKKKRRRRKELTWNIL